LDELQRPQFSPETQQQKQAPVTGKIVGFMSEHRPAVLTSALTPNNNNNNAVLVQQSGRITADGGGGTAIYGVRVFSPEDRRAFRETMRAKQPGDDENVTLAQLTHIVSNKDRRSSHNHDRGGLVNSGNYGVWKLVDEEDVMVPERTRRAFHPRAGPIVNDDDDELHHLERDQQPLIYADLVSRHLNARIKVHICSYSNTEAR
jgi:hypothetical protein